MPKFVYALAHSGAIVVAAAVLVAAGQPLFTDDLWWHLALGEAYASAGPWLAADPLLFTATAAPTPSAWLSDAALHGIQRGLGFAGLRIVHVLFVAALLALVWRTLRRASSSALLASVGLLLFTALSAFRLFQLRPHLVTILGVLVLFTLLFARAQTPTKARVAACIGLFALWANLHSGFLLGPILLTAGLGGVMLAAAWGPAALRPVERARAKALGVALVLGSLATLANPSGWEPHLSYFVAGEASPALARVGDEWARFRAFHFPDSPLPPSALGWVGVWFLLLATPIVAALEAARSLRETHEEERIDFAWIALALVSLPAMWIAVRFTWLSIFPLLLLLRSASLRVRAVSGARMAIAAASAVVALGFFQLGAWRAMSGGIPPSAETYLSLDYPSAKWFGHGVWFLQDAGLEGNVFNDYFMGGFLGFWLAPELLAFQNGTLNIPLDAHAAMRAIRERQGLEGGPGFEALLDEYRVDLVFGIRLPERQRGPWHYTTGLMERAPGWLPVFRNLRSSIHLRANPHNRENLERIVRYYAAAGVPFDPAVGFDAARVLRESPRWARQQGLVPVHFEQLQRQAQRSVDAADELASVYASLGLYERALQLDDRSIAQQPERAAAWRRKLFCLMRLDRPEAALAAAKTLEASRELGPVARALVIEAGYYARLDDPEQAASLAARTTFLTAGETKRLRTRIATPELRSQRSALADSSDL